MRVQAAHRFAFMCRPKPSLDRVEGIFRVSHVPAELAWLIADQLGPVYAHWLAVSEQELQHEALTSAELIALAVLRVFPLD